MPLNSSPPVLDGQSFDLKLEAAKRSSLTDFALWGGLTPKNLDRMEELAERGVVGFKAFMCDSGIEDFPYADNDTLIAGMRTAARLGLPVAVHAEDPLALARAPKTITGSDWSDYLASRPVVCETAATRIAIQCAKEAACLLHVVHVSSPLVLDVIRFERDGGADVTCETCPHYFMLCDEDLPRIGARAKCAPPLRTRHESEMLGARLHGGEIDFVASDHSPAPPGMKAGDSFAAWGGIAGVQTTFASLLTTWMNASYPLRDLPRLTAANAATRFKVLGRGRIAVGEAADLALMDMSERFVLTGDMLLDRHKLSPYVGRTFRGVIRRTILRGRTIFMDGKVIGPPAGRFVRPAR
jgi:allantoinase